ncbi:MAG: type II toxin-antitoxin system HicA family toxin [bacterium]
MTKLPTISGKDLVKIIIKLGFSIARQKGSHLILKHSDGRVTVVPCHNNEDLDKGLLKKILRDIDMSMDDFIKIIK